MTIRQEANALIMSQPEDNVRLIVELLRRMGEQKRSEKMSLRSRRTGIANGLIDLSTDFDTQFDELDGEIADMFTGNKL